MLVFAPPTGDGKAIHEDLMKTALASLIAAALLTPPIGNASITAFYLTQQPPSRAAVRNITVQILSCPCGRPLPAQASSTGVQFWTLRVSAVRPGTVQIQRCPHNRYFRVTLVPNGSQTPAGVVLGNRIVGLASGSGAPNRKGNNGRGTGESPPPPGWTKNPRNPHAPVTVPGR
jgi:hypothetical protein